MRRKIRKRIPALLLTAAITLNSIPVYASPVHEDILQGAGDTVLYQDDDLCLHEDIIDDRIEETLGEAEDTAGEIITGDDTETVSDVDLSDDIISDDDLTDNVIFDNDNSDTDKADDGPILSVNGVTESLPVEPEEYSMGERPVREQVEAENPSYNRLRFRSSRSAEGTAALPSSFVPDDLPQLRDQNPYQTCWSFSSIALAEMSLIRQGKISAEEIDSLDLSELHLAFFSYNTVTDPLRGTIGDVNRITDGNFLNGGGNREFTKNILAAWTGAADESIAPYSCAYQVLNEGLSDELAYLSSAHLKDYYDLTLITEDAEGNIVPDENGMRAAKELIQSNGAVGLSFRAAASAGTAISRGFYNSDNNCYYDPGTGNTNHAVTIVGWDDEFDRNRFTRVPEGDGAWLVRNSWRSGGSLDDSMCYEGYFWLSYYNKNTGEYSHAFVFDTSEDYDNNYQYDGGMATGLTIASKAANIFTAHAGEASREYEKLRAASFYTGASDVDYTIDVYTHLKDGNDPESGRLMSTVKGTTTYAGYYTVPIDDEVTVPEGEKFSVVVTLEKQNGNPYIGVEYTEKEASWYRIDTEAAAGQSFVVFNGEEQWTDYGKEERANVKIKAFTDTEEKEERFEISFADGTQGESFREYDYTGNAVKPVMDVRFNGLKLEEGTDYTVSYRNNTAAYTPASADLTGNRDPQVIIALKGDYSGKYIRNFKINSVDMGELYLDGAITAQTVSAAAKRNSKGIYQIQKLKPVIYFRNKKLKEGTDYVLVYGDGREGAYSAPSIAGDPWQITVKPCNGSGNFTGSFTVGEILRDNGISPCIPLSNRNVKVTLDASSVEYGGKLPGYTLTFTDPEDKSGTAQPLIENVDFTAEVHNADAAGTAEYIFTAAPGSDRFTGSVSKTFKISRMSLSKGVSRGTIRVDLIPENAGEADEDTVLAKDASYTYVKDGVRPGVRVIFTDTDGNKRMLRSGTDYKLTYGNNNAVRSSGDLRAPYVKVTGMGSFGGNVTERFSVLSGDLEELPELIASDVPYSKVSNAYKKTTVIVLDRNGKRLVKGKDYTVTDFRTEDGSTAPEVGTVITAVVKGKGTYRGSRNISYTVRNGDISRTSITFYNDRYMDEKVSGYTYTGREIRPEYIEIRAGSGRNAKLLTKNIDYVIAGYYDNIKKGRGHIIIKGTGEYGGIKVFAFKITARNYVK